MQRRGELMWRRREIENYFCSESVLVAKNDIDSEVTEKLDAIVAVARRATPKED